MPKARIYLLDGDLVEIEDTNETEITSIAKHGFTKKDTRASTFYPVAQIQKIVLFDGGVNGTSSKSQPQAQVESSGLQRSEARVCKEMEHEGEEG